MQDFPVVRVITEGGGGSGVSLGSGLVLLSRHQLRGGISSAEFSGVVHEFDLIDAGRTGDDATSADDWALIRLRGETSRLGSASYRPDLQLNPQDTVYLLGYWSQGKPLSRADAQTVPAGVFEARVEEAPFLIPSRSNRLWCEVTGYGEGLALYGVSGGPAVAVDPHTGELVVVGIFSGGSPYLGVSNFINPEVGVLCRVVRPDVSSAIAAEARAP